MRRAALLILLLLPAAAAPAQPWTVPVLPPELLGGVSTPGDAYDVWWTGGYAYVPDYDAGLHVIDVSIPAAPAIVGTYDSPGFAIQTVISGTRAYVADHTTGGLQIVNVTNALLPTHIGDYITGNTALAVDVMGSLAAVGYLQGSIELVDVSVPAAPVPVGSYPTPGAPRHIAHDGNLLYVADNAFGLIILDIGNPAAPVPVGDFDTGGRPVGLELDGALLYFAGGENGLEIFDISAPSAPQRIASLLLPGPAVKVTRGAALALVADHVQGGLQVVEVSDPRNPVSMGGYLTGTYAHGVAVAGELACLADGDGLKVFRVLTDATPAVTPAPAPVSLEVNFPNPFSGGTHIRWATREAGPQRLEVFDALGRRVRTLFDGWRDAGAGVVQWDGRSGAGVRVAGGVYFCRLTTKAGAVTRRMVLVR